MRFPELKARNGGESANANDTTRSLAEVADFCASLQEQYAKERHFHKNLQSTIYFSRFRCAW
jgi:hypothetical protein